MKIRLLFFLGLTLSMIQAASAQTFTWIAGPVGEWSDGSNWSTGTAPGGPGTAIITNHGIARLSTANGGTEYLNLGTLGGDGLVEGTVIINASRQLVVSQSLVAGVNADAGGEIFTTGTLIARELILGQSGFGWLRLGTGGSVKVGFNPSPGGGPMSIAVNAGSSAIIDIEGVADLDASTITSGLGTAAINFKQSGTVTFKPTITGGASVTQQGAGTTIFTKTYTYTGGTTISSGTLQLGDGASNGSIIGNVTNNGSLVFKPGSASQFSGIISGTGSVTKLGPGDLKLRGAQTYTGGTTISEGWLVVGDFSSPSSLIAGPGSTAVTVAGGSLALQRGSIRGGAGIEGGTIGGDGGAAVVQTVTGTINTAPADTTIIGGVGGNASGSILATAGDGGAAVIVNPGAATAFTNNGSVIGGAGGNVLAGGIRTGGNGGAGVLLDGAGTVANRGTITGGQAGSGLTFAAGGVGVRITAGGGVANESTGTVTGGMGTTGRALALEYTGMAGALVNKGTIVGGVSMGNYANYVELHVGSLITGGTLDIGTNTGAQLALDGSGTQSLAAAVEDGIAFAGSLKKQGFGTWIIDEALTHAGGTNVLGGSLIVESSLGDVDVAIGTLGGTGSVGNITLGTGTTLAPGGLVDTVGTLTADSLTWSPFSSLAFELGDGENDRLDLAGAFTKGLDGELLFTFENAGWQVGQTYTLVQFSSTNFGINDFAFTNGDGFDGSFALNENSLTFTVAAVPEPSTFALGIAALFGTLIATRRRSVRIRQGATLAKRFP